ncbi:MAG: type II toxin-antitoxin system VapC family toxin [Deltaproteobacteria bacterium]|nr:type II toxin-antitoxin system VapC family toxin [Deltaproteobacteria bacterium]
MSSLIIFDTSIFVDHLRSGRHRERLDSVTGLIRTSAVVLSELWRGAARPAEKIFLKNLEKNHPIYTPTEKNWLEAGQLLGRMQADRGFSTEKLRDLHLEVLIALTAGTQGAFLITSNRADFELIRGYREFKLEIW